MNRKHYLKRAQVLITCTLFLISCSQHNSTDFIFEGRKIQLSFDPLYEFKHGDLFKIDSLVIYHTEIFETIVFRSDTLFVPASNYVARTYNGQQLRTKAYAMNILGYLHAAMITNKVLKDKYFVSPQALLISSGKVVLEAKGHKKIQVLWPKTYGLHVTEQQ
jgi:hypothetical protein